MTLLLDTHLILWAGDESAELSERATAMISDPANDLRFSTVNIWEVVIKSSLGRTDFMVNPNSLREKLRRAGYRELAISSEHALAVGNLPALHKDPFDRILVAQARVEGFTLLTSDPVVASYPGPILKV